MKPGIRRPYFPHAMLHHHRHDVQVVDIVPMDARLRLERGIGFEEIVFHIAIGDLVEILEHPRPERYPAQRIFVVRCREYAHLVPFVEGEEVIVLKTIIPSRRVTNCLREEGKKP